MSDAALEHEYPDAHGLSSLLAWLNKQKAVRSGEYEVILTQNSEEVLVRVVTSTTGYCIGFSTCRKTSHPESRAPRYYLRNHTQGDYREVKYAWWRRIIRENFSRWR